MLSKTDNCVVMRRPLSTAAAVSPRRTSRQLSRVDRSLITCGWLAEASVY